MVIETIPAGRETTAQEAAQNRGWERQGERLRRQAQKRTEPGLWYLLFGGTDWAEVARHNAEDAAAARAMLPRLRVLLEGTGAELSVNRDGPHPLEGGPAGLEYEGYFVTVGCPATTWPEVLRRLHAAGMTWIVEAGEEGGREVADLLDWPIWRGTCPFGCGRVYADVEGHAEKCERAREGPQEPPQGATGAGAGAWGGRAKP
jgi:hypothetical protein